jgi:glycine/D-amino acid oxidase-like deaminating enzyme
MPGTDVAIIGDGVIGLSTALELARAGASCCLIGTHQDGAASAAAAGLLAPTVGRLSRAVRPFFMGSLDRYPEFLESLREFDSGLSMVQGVIEISGGAPANPLAGSSTTLSTEDVSRLEPELSAPTGGFLHPRDGAIDNVRLVRSLRLAVTSHPGVRLITGGPAESVAARDGAGSVTLVDGTQIVARHVVIAAGAWSPHIRGLPRPLPVSPLKGQMLALGATSLRHGVMGDDVYLVPREHEIVVGATTEHAGFDSGTTPQAIGALQAAAVSLCPALASAPLLRAWAGIRPATPDMLPILGPDPDSPWLLYACGHSKNGILLAPATASAITSLIQGTPPDWGLTPFAISRFH